MESNEPGLRLVGAVATQAKGALFCLAFHVLGFFSPFKLSSRIFLLFLIYYLVLRPYFGPLKHGKNVTLNLCGIICFKQLLLFMSSLNSSSAKRHY